MRITPVLLLLLSCAAPPTPAPTPPAAEPAPEPTPDDQAEVSEAEPIAQQSSPGVREQSVKPGINDAWKSSDVEPLVARLESESREIWVHRERLIREVGAKPGMVVADIGAGSGFLTVLLAAAVGPQGTVYALDINPTLLEGIDARAKAAQLTNVKTMLTPEDTTPLTPESVDLVFMCDAYHHLEYPRSTMRSIHAALRPGGELVLIDFERIPGTTEPAMLDHVRAGKDVFRQEILADGFEIVREHDVEALKENYMIRFRKPTS